MRPIKITTDLIIEFARFNTGVRRAREAYALRDIPLFNDCPEPECGARATCQACRRRAKGLLQVATSETECAELIAIIERPGVRILLGCGTEAGYHRHRRRGQRACARCLRAHSAYAGGRR